MVNILVEGCDCVGKTSLIEALLKIDSRYEVVHLDAPHDYGSGIHMYIDMLYDLWHSDHKIYDRAHLSEMVYAPLKRGYSPYYMRAYEQLLPADTLLVLVYANEEAVIARFDGRYMTLPELPDILKRFREMFDNSLIPHKYELDTTSITPIEAARRLWYAAEHRAPGGDIDD